MSDRDISPDMADTALFWHVRKEDLRRDSATVVDPPFAAFDVVMRMDYEALAAENDRMRLALEEIESFPISGYHAGAAQRMARDGLGAPEKRMSESDIMDEAAKNGEYDLPAAPPEEPGT